MDDNNDIGKGNTIPVMEVEPWVPTAEVQTVSSTLLKFDNKNLKLI